MVIHYRDVVELLLKINDNVKAFNGSTNYNDNNNNNTDNRIRLTWKLYNTAKLTSTRARSFFKNP